MHMHEYSVGLTDQVTALRIDPVVYFGVRRLRRGAVGRPPPPTNSGTNDDCVIIAIGTDACFPWQRNHGNVTARQQQQPRSANSLSMDLPTQAVLLFER